MTQRKSESIDHTGNIELRNEIVALMGYCYVHRKNRSLKFDRQNDKFVKLMINKYKQIQENQKFDYVEMIHDLVVRIKPTVIAISTSTEIINFLDTLKSQIKIYQSPAIFESAKMQTVSQLANNLKRLREQYLIETKTHKALKQLDLKTPKLSERTW